MEKYLASITLILGLTTLINVVGFIGIYSLLKNKKEKENNNVKK